MKERPILFSGPMVRAILEGRKTQSRRVVKFKPPLSTSDIKSITRLSADGSFVSWAGGVEVSQAYADTIYPKGGGFFSPYGVPGDRLWVREAFNWSTTGELTPGENYKKCVERAGYSADCAVYRADGVQRHPQFGQARWRPSIHMPRYASRILLEVTDVRVERLWDISEEAAKVEGVEMREKANGYKGLQPGYSMDWGRVGTLGYRGKPLTVHDISHSTARSAFLGFWNGMNPDGDANPWVWVIDFKRVDP